MNAIIVYYSLEGNTDYAAKAIAAAMGADLLRLETVAPYPTTGAQKFLLGGRDAMTGVTPPLQPYAFDAAQYDTVVLATPLWAWTFAPALRTFLKENDLHGKKLGFVVCSMGGQDGKCFARLAEAVGASPDAPRLSLLDPLKRKKPENDAAICNFAAQMAAL